MYEKDGKNYPNSIEDFKPGEFIELSVKDNEVDRFEGLVALDLQPDVYFKKEAVWNRRENLSDLIKPPKFFGNIKDIVFEIMPEPAERLLDARERGMKFKKSPSAQHIRMLENSEDLVQRTRGFIITANTKSSGKPIQQVRTEVWYVPTGETIRRFITIPTKEEIPNETPEDTLTKIGQTVLRRKDILDSAKPDGYRPRRKYLG